MEPSALATRGGVHVKSRNWLNDPAPLSAVASLSESVIDGSCSPFFCVGRASCMFVKGRMARQRLQDIRDEYMYVGDPEGVQRNMERSQIDKRNGGCAAIVNGELYVWGGETEDIVRMVFVLKSFKC